MATTNRLKILVYEQELDYKSAEDLGISFQRIADNEADLSNKYGEFSYSFTLPITKTNSEIFLYANANGRKNIFQPNQDLPCKVYNNEQLLLDGVISLQAVTNTGFDCVLYSKLKEFADLIENKTLQDLQFPVIQWDYESSIINHINADYKSSDETYWQFPLTWYGTIYTPYDTYKNKVDYRGVTFDNEVYPHQQYYYCMNTVTSNADNRFYHHQLPPAFYISSLITQIFADAGWSVGGQLFNSNSFKRVVMLYAGDNDLFDRAVSASQTAYDDAGGILSTSGLTTPLYPAKLLPDMEQSEFLNGIVRMWGLYPIVSVENKTIKFVTYKELQGDTFNPYNITNKIFKETAKFTYMENNNPSIIFGESENFRVMGDNAVSTGDTYNFTAMKWKSINNDNLQGFFNRNGTSESIEIPFAAPTVKKTFVWNNENQSGSATGSLYTIMQQPLMSPNTPYDGSKFSKGTGYTYVFNNETTIKYNGSPTLHYFYGKSESDIVQRSGKGACSDYMYINIFTGGTQYRIPIGICSPFQLKTYRDDIDAYAAAPEDLNSRKTISSTYLRSLWNTIGTNTPSSYSGIETDYSLCFDDSGYFHDTLWTVFHQPKYDRFQKSEILEADMRMNAYDWQEMQLNRPVLYNGQVYHIVEISNYNPIAGTASLRLMSDCNLTLRISKSSIFLLLS